MTIALEGGSDERKKWWFRLVKLPFFALDDDNAHNGIIGFNSRVAPGIKL